MKRVLVLGAPGSGKSTFARALAARTGLPYVSIDALYWQPGWVEHPDPAAFRATMTREAAALTWIIDGNYLRQGAGPERLAAVDTVVWFDLPRVVCFLSVLRRVLGSYGKVRPEMAPGCPERFDPAFLRFVWAYRANNRHKFEAAFATLRPDQRLVVFRRRREMRAFLAANEG